MATCTSCSIWSCSLKHYSWLWAGSALLLSCLLGQLPHPTQVRGGPSFHSPQILTCCRSVEYTRDVDLAFGGNSLLLLQGHTPRHVPLSQSYPGHYQGPTCYHQLLTSGSFSLLSPSISASLHCAHSLLILFHFSTIYLLLLEALGSLSVQGCLQNVFRSALPCSLMHYVSGQ